MDATYTIGETAERSGFSASALRYYEGIGLVAPTTRTDAGYRMYDDEALARLAFIARAKRLGCTLEEITDLAGIWGGVDCGPVQRRFHDLLSAKLAETSRQMAELAALERQLRDAARRLAAPAADGPCSASCACNAIDALEPGVGEPAARTPIYDASAPIVCTATSDEIPARIEAIEHLRGSLRTLERTEHGLILRFPSHDAITAEVRRFADDEKACCRFWGFEVQRTADETALRWDGPPTVDEFFDELVRFLESDEPAERFAGLF